MTEPVRSIPPSAAAGRQVLRFAIIGLLSTALYFGLLLVLQNVVSSTLTLTLTCYAISMGFNFLAQGLFTFQLRRLTDRQLGRYAAMHGTAMVINSWAMSSLVDDLGLSLLGAQTIVTGCVTIGTFLVSRNWVYR